MSLFVIILLIFLGMLLLLIEIVVLPGITVAGIGGFAMLGFSVYIAFARYGNLAGFLTLAFVLIVSPILAYYLFKSRAGRKIVLNAQIDSKVETFDEAKIKPGDTGKTLGRLAPTGKARVNGETVEAQSNGLFIDENTEIVVLKVLSNKIIVEPKNSES